MTKKYIADYAKDIDLIGEIDYLMECKKNGGTETFIMQAPTGHGKTSYIINEFYNYCKGKGYKILFLLPRSAPTEQITKDTKNKTDVITVKTYQSITHDYITEGKCNLDYDYIICDECHFFVTDCLINTGTDICFDLIHQSRAFKIFMSATPEPFIELIFNYLPHPNTHEILITADNTVISDINFFDTYKSKTTKETIIDIMENVKGKAIIFCNSAAMAKELYLMDEFKSNSLFICSEHNEKYSQYIDKELRDKMIETHRFDCKYLICTSALDVGFSIEDETVKDIVCTFTPENWTNIIQSIGRKRQVNENDKATLHIRNFSQDQIDKAIERNTERYECINYYRKNGELAYMKEYRKKYDKNRLIVTDYRLSDDGTPQEYIKEDKFVLAYYEYQKKILQEIKKHGSYAEFLKSKLHITDDTTIRHKRKDDYIDSRLREIAAEGIIYTWDNLEELTKRMNVKSSGKKRKVLKRPTDINKRLQEMEKPFEIKITDDEQRRKQYQLVYTGQDE